MSARDDAGARRRARPDGFELLRLEGLDLDPGGMRGIRPPEVRRVPPIQREILPNREKRLVTRVRLGVKRCSKRRSLPLLCPR